MGTLFRLDHCYNSLKKSPICQIIIQSSVVIADESCAFIEFSQHFIVIYTRAARRAIITLHGWFMGCAYTGIEYAGILSQTSILYLFVCFFAFLHSLCANERAISSVGTAHKARSTTSEVHRTIKVIYFDFKRNNLN